MIFQYFLLISLSAAALSNVVPAEEYLTVRTESGEVRGRTEVTLLEERTFYAFKGIPYAKPPVGEHRFKAPQEVDEWSDVLDATEYGSICTQTTPNHAAFVGAEDCLRLNVFTPTVTPEKKLPVIFYIHGGGYFAGSSNVQGPKILLEEDVILVTINYRLGPLGFLSLNTAEYPGNMGLKDQLQALKWVNENIHHFGGDPQQITLYGHSSGGSSTSLHILSPASRGLFRRAISSSGAALNNWAMNEAHNHTEMILKAMGNPEASLADITEWLSEIDAHQLTNKTFVPASVVGESVKKIDFPWGPVVENEAWENTFLTKWPRQYYEDEPSDVDTMFGFNSAEMLIRALEDSASPELLKSFDEEFKLGLPLVGLNYSFEGEAWPVYRDEIRKFYFGDKAVNEETRDLYIKLLDDAVFVYGIDQSAKAQAKRSTGRTYYYQFSVQLALNTNRTGVSAEASGAKGAAHVEDMHYLFYTIEWVPENLYDGLQSDSAEGRLIKLWRSFIVNFVKFGNPTPNDEPIAAKPIEGDVVNYVDIQNDRLVAGVNPQQKYIEFWDRFFANHPELFKKVSKSGLAAVNSVPT